MVQAFASEIICAGIPRLAAADRAYAVPDCRNLMIHGLNSRCGCFASLLHFASFFRKRFINSVEHNLSDNQSAQKGSD